MKQLDWVILGLSQILNKEKELFFFETLEPKNVAFFVKFSKNECSMVGQQNWASNFIKVAWPSGPGVRQKFECLQ